MNNLIDPAHRPDRGCADTGHDVFFDSEQAEQAQMICAACPLLAHCAAWAAPKVNDRMLTGCVVAGVRVPVEPRRYQLDDAVAALDQVAVLGQVTTV